MFIYLFYFSYLEVLVENMTLGTVTQSRDYSRGYENRNYHATSGFDSKIKVMNCQDRGESQGTHKTAFQEMVRRHKKEMTLRICANTKRQLADGS